MTAPCIGAFCRFPTQVCQGLPNQAMHFERQADGILSAVCEGRRSDYDRASELAAAAKAIAKGTTDRGEQVRSFTRLAEAMTELT